MSVAVGIQHAMRTRHIVICGLSGSTIFCHSISKRQNFRKKKWQQKTRIFIFSIIFVRKYSHSKKNWARYDQKCIFVFTWSTCYSCPILMKLEFSRHIFEKYSKIKFHENPTSGNRVVRRGQSDGRTDMAKLIVAFSNFAKVPNKNSPMWLYT